MVVNFFLWFHLCWAAFFGDQPSPGNLLEQPTVRIRAVHHRLGCQPRAAEGIRSRHLPSEGDDPPPGQWRSIVLPSG